jgi:signal transduction histidine kinase
MPGSQLGGLKAGETRFVNVNGIRSYKCRKSRFVDRGFSRHFIMVEQLTGEILDTQKKAYGKVIRMMSHEINNTVGAINSILTSSLNYRDRLVPEDRKDFEGAMQVAIDRNTRLNRFMSNFADVVRIPPPSIEPHDLRQLLKTVQVLMAPECERRDVQWRWEIPESPMPVECDLLQMEQVLVNIVKNALEAIGRGGSITVIVNGDRPPRLRVIDTGKGISPEQKSQLFTPFFSTKRDGQGIGLTMIREILVGHGFAFDLETVGPERTEFWIDFNRMEPE